MQCSYCILDRRLGASEPLDDAFRQRSPRVPCVGVAVLGTIADGLELCFGEVLIQDFLERRSH